MPRKKIRDQRVVTFLTRDERTLLERIADDARVSVSRACHDLIVKSMHDDDALQQDRKPVPRNKK